MSHLAKVYAPWTGNAEKMAADIGELGVTVRQWRNRGSIPQRYWNRIIRAAANLGVELTAADFLADDHAETDTDDRYGAAPGKNEPVTADGGEGADQCPFRAEAA